MRMRKGLALLIAAAVSAGILAGCGESGRESGGESDKLTVIKIAAQSPLTGGSAVQGKALELGALMSLKDHQGTFAALGYRLQFVPYDDAADPATGVKNAVAITADPSVMGVVGHLNSGVSIPASVVYEKSGIPMVTPASTATELTDRGLKSVNRIVSRDDIQGAAAAEYAVHTVKAAALFVVHDKTAYGKGLCEAFEAEAARRGGRIVGHAEVSVGEKDFSGILSEASAAKPDLIFFAGLYAEGGRFIKQARERGITVPFMGGDGLQSSAITEFAGDAAKGTFYSSSLADISGTGKGKQWAADYRHRFGEYPEAVSAYAYDAMTVLLNALERAIRENGGRLPCREQVRDEVRDTQHFLGIAANVSFDGKGDNLLAEAKVYQFQ